MFNTPYKMFFIIFKPTILFFLWTIKDLKPKKLAANFFPRGGAFFVFLPAGGGEANAYILRGGGQKKYACVFGGGGSKFPKKAVHTKWMAPYCIRGSGVIKFRVHSSMYDDNLRQI